MNRVKIELDYLPSCSGICNSTDYNDYFLSQFLYSHLENQTNCEISNINYSKYKIELFSYWEKKGITSKNIINAFYHHAITKSPYKIFIPFIKKKGDRYAITYIDKRTFEIELIVSFKEFEKMLQSRYLIPFSDDGKDIKCGDYELLEYSMECIKLINHREDKIIEAWINDKPDICRENFLKNVIDITCPTNYSPNIRLSNELLIKSVGSLLYYCFFKDEELSKVILSEKEKLNKLISIMTKGYILPMNSFYSINNGYWKETERAEVKFTCSNRNSEYSLYYADYYPNKELATACKSILIDKGYKVILKKALSYEEYIATREKYDIYVGVTFPTYESEHAIGLMFAATLEPEMRKRCSRAIALEEEETLMKLLRCPGGYIPLGKGGFWYYKQPISYINISEYGYINV